MHTTFTAVCLIKFKGEILKKLSVVCIAFALSILVVLSGCTNKGARVFKYLKDTKEFADTSIDYDISLTVNDDLSFVLNVSCNEEALKDYHAEGSNMEYLGCYETSFTTEWLGVTQNNTKYEHAVKLTGATVEIDGKEEVFYLVASTTSKRSDSYYLTLVHHLDFEDYDSNLSKIVNGYPSYVLHKK